MLVPQLFMLYHRRYNTKTRRVHVEHLRVHGFVWWGRFSPHARQPKPRHWS